MCDREADLVGIEAAVLVCDIKPARALDLHSSLLFSILIRPLSLHAQKRTSSG